MSLVGPRPERPELADELLRTMPVYRKRLEVRPGITGWAQINQGYDREMDDVRRKLEYDLYYVKHCGPLFDTAILLRTIDAVIFGKPRRPARPDLP
jgi:lipopolysaccharide/colanic/teichoic acid biosynthesis glycosyltransferase